MTPGQTALYEVIKRNNWATGSLRRAAESTEPYEFWIGVLRHRVTPQEIRYVLARLTLEGVKLNDDA